MDHLNENLRTVVKNLGASDLLPMFPVYKVFSDSIVHLGPSCVPASASLMRMIDIRLDSFCDSCSSSPTAAKFKDLHFELQHLRSARVNLEDAKKFVADLPDLEPYEYIGVLPDVIGHLNILRGYIPNAMNFLEKSEHLSFLVESCAAEAEHLQRELVSFLQLDVSKNALVASYCVGTMEEIFRAIGPQSYSTHFLVDCSDLRNEYFAVVSGWGTKVGTDRLLVSGPIPVLAFVSVMQVVSPVNIPAGTDQTTLETFAALWDAESSGVLKDAEKAFQVATQLC